MLEQMVLASFEQMFLQTKLRVTATQSASIFFPGGKTAFNFGLNLHRCRQIAQSTITINTATTGGGGLGTDPIPNPAIASLDFGPTGKMRNDAEGQKSPRFLVSNVAKKIYLVSFPVNQFAGRPSSTFRRTSPGFRPREG